MEKCSDSKVMQSVFNGRTLNTIFGWVGFIRLTTLEEIRIIQDGMVDELSGNTIAEFRKSGTFVGFIE